MASAQRSLRTRERTPQATARSKDLAVAGVIAILGVAVWIESGTWVAARNLAQDPTVLPRSIAVLLWLVAIGIVVRLVRTSRAAPVDATAGDVSAADLTPADDDGSVPEFSAAELIRGGDEEEIDGGDTSLSLGLVAIATISIYAWLSYRLGWAVTSWVFLTGAVLALGEGRVTAKRAVFVGVIAAVAVGVLYVAFFQLLSVRSPNTLLP